MQAQQNSSFISPYKLPTPALNHNLDIIGHNANQLSRVQLNSPAQQHFLLSWTDQIYNYQKSNGIDVVDSMPYYTYPVFMDSTAKMLANKIKYTIGIQRVGSVCDPKSPLFDPNFAGNALLNSTTAYRLDTIFIGGFYNMVAPQTDPTVGDSIYIEVAWGDTSSTSTWEHIFSSVTGEAITQNINPSKLSGHHAFQRSSANTMHFTRVLTPKDSVIVNNPFARLIVCPVPTATGSKIYGGLSIPANNDFVVSYTFIPGSKSNYVSGDVIVDYDAFPSAQSNGFAQLYSTQANLNASNSNAHNYWLDQKKYYNEPLDYFNWQQYEMATSIGAPAILDSIMLPEANTSYQIIYAITTLTTGINPINSTSLKVGQNVPNPCSQLTYINYELKDANEVSLHVYDITGQLVMSQNIGYQNPGEHLINLTTNKLQAGVYFYTLDTGIEKVTKRMVVAR